MGFEFVSLVKGQCVLCGAHTAPTGEHKIKASLIKAEFGNRATIISGKDAPKVAQGPRSKQHHFKQAPLCRDCNSSRSQPGDRAFDSLHSQLKQLRDSSLHLTDNLGQPRIAVSESIQRDSFRYFAKILCCFLAEVGGLRSRSISSFAIGRSDFNPVHLRFSDDTEYEASIASLGASGFVRHGGLLFKFDESKTWVNSIESSLSAGGIHYEFWVQLRPLPKLELRIFHSGLIKKALDNIVDQ